jgi:ribosomal protein S18 acetylase RimI-like enzyme
MICLAEKKDALKIAEIHKQEIKMGFLSSLPISFLEKIYLSVIENDFCVVAKENDNVVGFIAGTIDIKKLYSFFSKKYFFYSIMVFLPKILNVKKIIEDIFYIKKEEIRPELLTIAVKENFQGQGIAKKMFEVFVSEMKRRGVKMFKVVVGDELKPAISFYEKNGFEFVKETEVHKGQKSRIYIYHL